LKMKKMNQHIYKLIIVLFTIASFISCEKNNEFEPLEELIIIENFNLNALFNGEDEYTLLYTLPVGKESGEGGVATSRSGMYEGINFLNNVDSISFKYTINDLELQYGTSQITESTSSTMAGNLIIDESPVHINSNGLYHTVVDRNTSRFVFNKIDNWTFYSPIATDETDKALTLISSDDTSATWTIDDVIMSSGIYSIRYNNSNTFSITADVNAFSFIGGEFTKTEEDSYVIDKLSTGEYITIDNQTDGVYNIRLVYGMSQGFSAAFYKTADVPDVGPAPAQWGLKGPGASGIAGQAGWDADDILLTYVGVIDGNHTWFIPDFSITRTGQGTEEGDFKFRQNLDWTNKITYTLSPSGSTLAVIGDTDNIGSDAGDEGNFFCYEPAVYDIVLRWDNTANHYEVEFIRKDN
jgi:hypothetical protein